MHKLKRLLWIVLAIALIGVGAALHYVLPRHQLVHVIGNEVKLVNTPQATAPGATPVTRGQDVFYISTTDLERKNVHVFRNEDTGWGFPWYLKFDSAEVQARAQLLALKESQMAVVRYYGWRLPMFSMFPNAVNIWATDTAETPLPLFNILFFSVLILVAVTVWWKIRRFRQRRQAGNQPV